MRPSPVRNGRRYRVALTWPRKTLPMPWSGTSRIFSVRRDHPRKPTDRKVISNGADLASASSASVAPAMCPRHCESGCPLLGANFLATTPLTFLCLAATVK